MNGTSSKRLTTDVFDRAVAKASIRAQIPADVILSRRQTKAVVRARQFAMWLLRREGYSLPEIGRRFERDHATVYWAVSVMDRVAAGERVLNPRRAERPSKAAA